LLGVTIHKGGEKTERREKIVGKRVGGKASRGVFDPQRFFGREKRKKSWYKGTEVTGLARRGAVGRRKKE